MFKRFQGGQDLYQLLGAYQHRQPQLIIYYPVINNPITDYKTVQQCLEYAESASREVGQDFIIRTFDLGVCMKVYPLIRNNPLRYQKHIVMIGSFHVICAYLKMLGKKMKGTGLDDIIV